MCEKHMKHIEFEAQVYFWLNFACLLTFLVYFPSSKSACAALELLLP